MTSSISDFGNRIKKIYPDIGIVTNYGDEIVYNQARSNLYKRVITVDNTSKTVKANWYISFIIDHLALFQAGKSGFNFNDLRVLDTDDSTPLSYYVEAPCTQYCRVWVLIPSIPASSYSINIYYGNPALPSLSNRSGVIGSIFSDSRLLAWYRANASMKYEQGGLVDNQSNHYWESLTNRQFSLYQSGVTAIPIFYKNKINSNPAIQYDGTNDIMTTIQGVVPTATNYNIWAVVRRNSNKSNNYFLGDNGAGSANNSLHMGWRNNTTFTLAQFANDLDYTVSGYSSPTWEVWNGELNTAVGHYLRLNGAQVASNVNTTGLSSFNLLTLGGALAASVYSDVEISDLLIFSGATALTSGERTQVWTYLNNKNAVYSTTDWPTSTVGSETTSGLDGYLFSSYAPFSNFTTKSKNEIGEITTTSGDCTIDDVFNYCFAAGNGTETWSGSTLDSSQKLNTNDSRKLAISSVAVADEYVFSKNLSLWRQTNETTGGSYLTSDNDYITFEFLIEDASKIDFANSSLNLYVSAGVSYYILFSDLCPDIVSNTPTLVSVKKSAFTKSGAGTWANPNKLRITVKTTSGSQSIYYANFRQRRNWATDTSFNPPAPISISQTITGDNSATYYTQNIITLRITGTNAKGTDLAVQAEDYLSLVRKIKLGDLPAFPANYFLWYIGGEGEDTDSTHYYSIMIKYILGFVFPGAILDVDCDMLVGDVADLQPNLSWYYCGSWETWGDVLDQLLKACAGYIVWDHTSGKYKVRGGYKYWDTLSASYPTPRTLSKIYSYSDNTGNSPLSYNTVKHDALYPRLNYSLSYNPLPGGLGVSDLSIPIRATSGADDFVLVSINHQDLFKSGEYRGMLNQYFVGFNCVLNSGDTSYSNSGITLTRSVWAGENILLFFQNTSGAKKILVNVPASVDFVGWDKLSLFTGSNYSTGQVVNSSFVSREGTKNYEVEERLSFVRYNATTKAVNLPTLYSDLVNVLYVDTRDEIEIQYDPYLYVGEVVEYTDRDNIRRQGIVTGLDTYSDTATQKVTLRRLK